MRIWNQWKPNATCWGVNLLGFFWTVDFWGISIVGFVFEWPRSQFGQEVQNRRKEKPVVP
jgi:hypothetical protein